jgi:RNA polymerase sigma-70 factor (ECF subfamily)
MSSTGTSFATTHWSVITTAREADSPAAREALERLCRAYWYPLYAYVRRTGRNAQDAQDLTQAFFLHLLDHGYLAHADPRKGRFRTFLLVALNRFLTNEWHHDRALKRGGGCAILSWDDCHADERYAAEPFSRETAEQLFEQRWALAVVGRTMERLRGEFSADGRPELFEALKIVLTGEATPEPYAVLAARLGLSEAAIKMSALRLRRRFGEILREEVAQTVSNPADLDGELRHLLAVLATAPPV